MYCPNVVVQCKHGCGVEYPRSSQEWHINNECVRRLITCQYCETAIPVVELQVCDSECFSNCAMFISTLYTTYA